MNNEKPNLEEGGCPEFYIVKFSLSQIDLPKDASCNSKKLNINSNQTIIFSLIPNVDFNELRI